jgi:hypothetical protein
MAVRNIAITDTIEKFRTEFNAMTLNDFGDIDTLSGSISATTIVGAVNECIAIISSTAGWTMVDSSSTTQIVGGGQQAHFLGTSNETEVVVSAGNVVTIGLPSSVTVTTQLTSPIVVAGNLTLTDGSITDSSGTINFGNENLTTTGNITGTGATHTLGTIQISGNTIISTDSTQMIIDDSLKVNGPLVAGVTTINPAGSNNIESSTGYTVFGSSPVLAQNKSVFFEGATDDAFETNLTVADPTAARTITLPDATGTVALTNATGYATSTIFSSAVSLIIYNSAGVAQKTIFGSAT